MNKNQPKYTSVRVGENFAVVRPDHRLVGDHETDEFEAIVKQLADQRLEFVVVDLGAIDWINSIGLRALYTARRLFAERGTRLRLARVDKRIHSLLILTKLALFFETFHDVKDAIAAGTGEPDEVAATAPA